MMENFAIEIYSNVDRALDLGEQTGEGDPNIDEVLIAIKVRVAQLLDRDPNLLFSYLYRLDVLEKDLKMAFSGLVNMNAVDAIAELIMERQKDRLETKLKYKQDPIEGWGW